MGRRPNSLEDIGRLAIAVQKLVSERRGTRDLTRVRLNKEVMRARNTLLAAIRSWRRRNEEN